MKFTKTALCVKALLLLLAAVLAVVVVDLRAAHGRLLALERAWEAAGPHTSVVGRLRARLAALHWLRPSPPRDPFNECGIPPKGDDWWSFLQRLAAARERLACLEGHMAAARAEHGRLEDRLFSRYVAAAVGVTVVCCLLGAGCISVQTPASGVQEEEGHEGQRSAGPAPSRGEKEPAAGSSDTRASTRRLTWRWPLDMLDLSPRVVSVHGRLRDAMKATVLRHRRKVEGQTVPHDSLDWWRGADDGRGKLVVQPRERRGEKLRPYPYPRVPSVDDPWAFLPQRPRPRSRQFGLQQQQPQDGAPTCLVASRWASLSRVLQVLQVLLLAYLCLREAAAR